MRIFPGLALAAGAALISLPAHAQTAPATEAPAAAPAAPAAAAPVTDAEVSSFVTAAVAIEPVQKDATLADADKQKQMVAKVQAAGLEPARFNEIAQTMQADPALKQRIQVAFAKQKPAK